MNERRVNEDPTDWGDHKVSWKNLPYGKKHAACKEVLRESHEKGIFTSDQDPRVLNDGILNRLQAIRRTWYETTRIRSKMDKGSPDEYEQQAGERSEVTSQRRRYDPVKDAM